MLTCCFLFNDIYGQDRAKNRAGALQAEISPDPCRVIPRETNFRLISAPTSPFFAVIENDRRSS